MTQAWNETVDLPERTTWLLEASAGTGKTYQIAGQYLRLVAEYGVSVERMLAITFTTAATAELRERIRARLRDALEMLRSGVAPKDDTVLAHLFTLGERDAVVARLEIALRTFDLAPISTIHGFSQRMLQELAFDSGQDSDLELLADAVEILEERVDDALASLYARASAQELAFYDAANFDRKRLVATARAMCGAVGPAVIGGRDATLEEELVRVRAWAAVSDKMRARWEHATIVDAVARLRADAEDGLLDRFRGKSCDKAVDAVRGWLADGGCQLECDAFEKLRPAKLQGIWKGSAPIEKRPWWAAIQEIEAFCAAHALFWSAFAPLARFARGVRARVEAELVRRRALTFDGMLSRLSERVQIDGGAEAALAKRIRERFDAAFVDEFQDTDQAQWRVIEAAFHGHRRLFLIGDPKQAIYAFRGADVHVYLEAAKVVAPARRRTMVYNFRSDPRAVTAMNTLFRAGSGAFDQPAVDYVAVTAKRRNRLTPTDQGLDVRWLDARAVGGKAGDPLAKVDTTLASRLAAREALAWLQTKATTLTEGHTERGVEPADLAVLVNTHREAQAVRHALGRVGIPSVAASKETVFDSDAAIWIAAWLDAVAGAGRDRDARTAVVTPLFGWSGDELAWALALADGGERTRVEADRAGVAIRDWNAWTERLRDAAERWAKHGFARTFDREATEQGVLARLLALPNGERHATDVRHLFELLHLEERRMRCGPGILAAWLRAQIGVQDEGMAQRLESDARAVRIETVHVSKGLEYPIVLLPFAWVGRADRDDGTPFILRGPGGAELHAEAPRSAGRGTAMNARTLETRREALRTLYVGLTRAKHRTVAWYGPCGRNGTKTSATALGRLLMRDPNTPGFDDDSMPVFDGSSTAWPLAERRLTELAKRSEATISWQAEAPLVASRVSWSPAPIELSMPRAASWPSERRSIGGPWLVASYSGLAAGSAAPDRDEKIVVAHVPEGDTSPAAHDEATPIARPPLVTFPARERLSRGRGTQYGTWVHEILEKVDFATGAGKDGSEAKDVVTECGARLGLASDRAMHDELAARLPGFLDTPLGATNDDAMRGLPAGFTLRQLGRRDRLDELSFDLRLGDGTRYVREPSPERETLDARSGCVDPRKVYDAILTMPPSPGLSAWLAHLKTRRDEGIALIGSIAGILTGSIDLVLRVDGRYFVADYKTNRIGTSEPGHYAGAWLDWAMATAGYPLQALIYTLALHRHLKSRLRGYEYDAHVGGYLYLFLRGMSGADTPRDPETGRCLGVHGDRFPKQVIEGLDAALSPEVTR